MGPLMQRVTKPGLITRFCPKIVPKRDGKDDLLLVKGFPPLNALKKAIGEFNETLFFWLIRTNALHVVLLVKSPTGVI